MAMVSMPGVAVVAVVIVEIPILVAFVRRTLVES
jgi:hypothetical protein